MKKEILALSAMIVTLAVSGKGQITEAAQKQLKVDAQVSVQRIGAVKPLDTTARTVRIREELSKLNSVIKKSGVLALGGSITLGVNSVGDNRNFLYLYAPDLVVPRDNYASFPLPVKNQPIGVGLSFYAPKKGYYAIDLTLDCRVKQNLQFKGGTSTYGAAVDTSTSTCDSAGHYVFITKELEEGTAVYYLTSDNNRWSFSSVTITNFTVGK